ncbi:RNA polymerase II-associated factor 1 [Fasciola gigantica]|uniref:RNA polymerase II-associated factor 1 homolog n=1 Tax=Fasciola gigantica TaxID=46835 RepID=A0A504YZG9_FASGI|nr:RNA polymerase II-associated factor 1 [Fasciola gigantica]
MTLSQTGKKVDEKADDYAQDRAKDIRPESLLCRLKYHNHLPELPFDPKFLSYPLEPSRMLPLLKLHPDDERLLEDDTPAAINARKSRHQKSVSWLRRTEYISTELYNRWNKSEKVESKLGYSVKRHLNEEIVYRDRESQINAIEATFKAARKPVTKHYSKPNVHAVEVLPVLPDFALWRYPCAQVIFDDDPSRKNKSSAEQKEEVNQAMIRGMVDESGDHFVAYFLPTESTKQLRRLDAENRIPYTENAAYEYELAREYNWNVKNKTMANYEENYFFVFRKDGVFYNELETRVRLSKRRKVNPSGSFVTGGGGAGGLPAPKTRLIVHHRDFTDDELKAQTDRLYMLEHDVEGDDDDDEDDGEGAEGGAEGAGAQNEEHTDEHAEDAESPSPKEAVQPNRTQATESDDDLSEEEEEEEMDEEDSDRSEPAQQRKHPERRPQPAPRASTSQVYQSDDGDDLSDLSD